jgi:phosphate transport system ATP-binding protein
MIGLKEKFIIENLSFYYGEIKALNGININIYRNRVTALIGPSGCGKSTFLRCLNRMNDTIPNTTVTGKILLDGKDIYDPEINLPDLRQKVGMVFQKPNPFTKTIFDNVTYGPRRLGLVGSRNELSELVEYSLKSVGLWGEVKDNLSENALSLSLGQQQRLCIARVIAVKPEVILMDEPASALDPMATATLEELIDDLKKQYTVIIVTHNMEQAARVSDFTGLFWLGELIEFSNTEKLFTRPEKETTESYITGRMG